MKKHCIGLPPGFRFHPTDEELVVQYLQPKVLSHPLPASIILDVDVCKYDPWDLPGVAEQERYFFSNRKVKHPNGNRPNRATRSGYWKATGLDKQIVNSKSRQLAGKKKTLVFYCRGCRTDWVMHEYRLISRETEEKWVLCRIFLKRRNAKGGFRALSFVNNLPPSPSSSGITEISKENKPSDLEESSNLSIHI